MSTVGMEYSNALNALGHTNAELYLQLARIVVWAGQNREMVATSPTLHGLLETVARTLASVDRGSS